MIGIKTYHFEDKTMKVIDQCRLLKLSKIELKYDNPRTIFDDEEMDELISSVKESGVLNPIWCSVEDNTYYLIAGERRLRASKSVGLSEIPARIFQINTEKEARILQSVENEQRTDLSQEERFDQFTKMENLGMSITDMAKMTGISTTKIRGILNLKDLSTDLFRDQNVDDFAKTQLAKLRENEQIIMAKKLNTTDQYNNFIMTGRKLYEDVVKNIRKLEKDDSVSEEQKEKIRAIVVNEATKDVLAERIIAREKEKIRLRLEGKFPTIIDETLLEKYINESDKYYRLVLEMVENKVEFANPRLVKSLALSIAAVRSALNELTGGINKNE